MFALVMALAVGALPWPLHPAPARAASLPAGYQVFAGAKLVINGAQVFPDVPLVVSAGRMLVPIRIVAETLGADVDWDGVRSVAIVLTASRRIEMPIGSNKATINGESVTLDAAAILYQSRTLVPLRFVAEALGCDVGWDSGAATASVQSPGARLIGVTLDLRPESAVLRVATNTSVQYSVRTLADPPRLIVDLPGTTPDTGWTEMFLGQALIDRVLIGAPDAPGGGTRVIAELTETVRFGHRPATAGAGVDVEVFYKVSGVAWEDGGVTVKSSGPLASRVFSLTDPLRYVVDLPGATLSGPAGSFEVGRDGISLVRYAQFQNNPDIVRVVLVLERNGAFRVVATPGGLRIVPDTAAAGLKYEATATGSRLTIQSGPATAEATLSADGRELRLDLRGASVGELTGAVVGDGLVESYEVRPGSGDAFTVLLYLASYSGHKLIVGGGVVTLELSRSSLAGRKIILDPGHGGRDPGCTSYSGIYERELNLLIAEALRPKLEAAGALVTLSRDASTDFNQFPRQTMDAYDRAAVANGWAADVFVSIHFNAHVKSDSSGTEVWHYGDKPDSLRLAKLMMDELAKLGLVNRGVKKGNYAVLRESNMPAVLVELGFLSNPGDEKFLLNPVNQAKAVQLMFEALQAYFR